VHKFSIIDDNLARPQTTVAGLITSIASIAGPACRSRALCRFYPRYAWEVLSKHVRLAAMHWHFRRILKRVERDPGSYDNVAMTPVQEDEFDELEIFTVTQAPRSAVNKQLHRKATAATSA
jgi:putative component of membrane protein insertase Oxa1/YidC/SpoIIIJ protein YidD